MSLPLLHQPTIDAVVADVATVTTAQHSELRIHRVIAGPGTGKSSLVGKLRQLLIGDVDRFEIRPIVVTIRGQAETGRLDIGAGMAFSQIKLAVASQDARRDFETARTEMFRGLANDLIGLIPIAGQTVTWANRGFKTYEYGRKMLDLRRAHADHRAAEPDADLLELTIKLLTDTGDDWKIRGGGRRAPTLVLLVDDVTRADRELVDWVAALSTRVMDAAGLSMSVVVMTTASASSRDGGALEVVDPVTAAMSVKLADAGLDASQRTVTWTDLDDEFTTRLERNSVEPFPGWSPVVARDVLVDLLEDWPATEREALAAKVVDRLAGRRQGINPKHLEALALQVQRKLALGPIDDAWVAALPNSREASADALIVELRRGEMSLEHASVFSVIAEANGHCLPPVLERTVRRLINKSGQKALNDLVELGVVEQIAELAISAEPLVALVSDSHVADVQAHLGRLEVSRAAVRRAYLTELGAELDTALVSLASAVAPTAVSAFLDRLCEIGIPSDLTPKELSDICVPDLAAAVLLCAGPQMGPLQRVERLLEVEPERRDGTWCQLVASLLERQGLQEETIAAGGLEALIAAAERQSLSGYAVDALVRVCSQTSSAALAPLVASATALVLELAGRELRAAHLLLQRGATDDIRRRAAVLLAAHLVAHTIDATTMAARMDLARYRSAAGFPADALELLLPVLGTGLDGCLAYAEVLIDSPSLAAEDYSADIGLGLVIATLRAHSSDHAAAAVRLVQLDKDLAPDTVLTYLRPHLQSSAPATENFVAQLGSDPTPVDRRLALRALHLHSRALPRRDVALSMARLADTTQERQAASIYVDSQIEDPLVAATLLAASDSVPTELGRVVDVLRRSAEDDTRSGWRVRQAAFAVLSAPDQRNRAGVLWALRVLDIRKAQVVGWAREVVADPDPDPWAVLVVTDAALSNRFESGTDALAGLLQVARLIDAQLVRADRMRSGGERMPDVVFDLCSRIVGIAGRAKESAKDQTDAVREIVDVRNKANDLLTLVATDYPVAAVHTLRSVRKDEATALMEKVYRAHSNNPRVLGELVRCGARTGSIPGGDLFWTRLCDLAGTNQDAAQVLLDVIRTTARDSKSTTMEAPRAQAGLHAVLELARLDVNLALRMLRVVDILKLSDRNEARRAVLEHAPFSARAAEASLNQPQSLGAPTPADRVAERLLLSAAQLAPDAAHGYVAWLTKGSEPLASSELSGLRQLADLYPVAALALLTRGSGVADALQALDACYRFTSRSSRRGTRGVPPAWLSEADEPPSALVALAAGKGARAVASAWASDAARDHRIALWLIARSAARISQTWPDTAVIEAGLRDCLSSGENPQLLDHLRELATRPDLAPVQLFSRLLDSSLAYRTDGPSRRSQGAQILVDAVARRAPVDPAISERALEAALQLRPDPATKPTAQTLHWAMSVARLVGPGSQSRLGLQLRSHSTAILKMDSAPAGGLAGADIAELLTVLDDEAAEHLWRSQVPVLLFDVEKRTEALQFASGRVGAYPALDALAVLIDPDESARDAYAEHVVRHVAELSGQDADRPWVTSVVALCSTRLCLTRDQRRAVSSAVAESSRAGARLARALLTDLTGRPAALAETVRALSAVREQLGLVELDVLATAVRGTPLAGAVRHIVSSRAASHQDAAVASYLLVVELGLFTDGKDPFDRQLRIDDLVQHADADQQLALALLSSGSLNENEAALIRGKVHDLGRCPPETLLALADVIKPGAPIPTDLIEHLRAEAFDYPRAAFAWLRLEQRLATQRVSGHARLDECLRVVTAVASSDPELIADTVDVATSSSLRLDVARWLTRLAVAADSDSNARRLADATRVVLERRHGKRSRHAQVLLATSPDTARRGGRALARACGGSPLTHFDAVALMATEKRDAAVRVRAEKCLRETARIEESIAYARVLSMKHPAALTVVATLQPQTGQPLRRLVRELELRASKDDLCAAELLDLLDNDPAVLGLSAAMHERYLSRALSHGQHWIRRGSEASCIPAARVAVRLSGPGRRPSPQVDLAKVLAEQTTEARATLRYSAYEAWDLLSSETRHLIPVSASHRPRRSAGPINPVRSSRTQFVSVAPAVATIKWSSAPTGEYVSATSRGNHAGRAASGSAGTRPPTVTRPTERSNYDGPSLADRLRDRKSTQAAAAQQSAPIPAARRSIPIPATRPPGPVSTVKRWAAALAAGFRVWGYPVLGVVAAVFGVLCRRQVVQASENLLGDTAFRSFLVTGESVVSSVAYVAELSRWPVAVLLALPAVAFVVFRNRGPKWTRSRPAAWVAASVAAVPLTAVVWFILLMAVNVALVLILGALLLAVAVGLFRVVTGSDSK